MVCMDIGGGNTYHAQPFYSPGSVGVDLVSTKTVPYSTRCFTHLSGESLGSERHHGARLDDTGLHATHRNRTDT